MLGISDWLPYLNFIIPFMIWSIYKLYGRNDTTNDRVNELEKELALNKERDIRTSASVEEVVKSFEKIQAQISELGTKIEEIGKQFAFAEGYKKGQGK